MLKCWVFSGKTGPIAMVQVFMWWNLLQQYSTGPNANLEPF